MSITDTLIQLMDASRDFFKIPNRMSISDLTGLLKPNHNLLHGSDDSTGPRDDYAVSTTSERFKGLIPIETFGGGHASAVCVLEPGRYTYSAFVKSTSHNSFDAALVKATSVKDEITIARQLQTYRVPNNEWNRYKCTFSVNEKASYGIVFSHFDSKVLIAGQKYEEGLTATPYIRQDGILIIAPLQVGGVTKAFLSALTPTEVGCAA